MSARPIGFFSLSLLAAGCTNLPEVETACRVEIPAVSTEWTSWRGTLGSYEAYVIATVDMEVADDAPLGTMDNAIAFGVQTGEDLSAEYPDECDAYGMCWVVVGPAEDACVTGDGEVAYDLDETFLQGDLTLRFPYEEPLPYARVMADVGDSSPYATGLLQHLYLEEDRMTGYEAEDEDAGGEDAASDG